MAWSCLIAEWTGFQIPFEYWTKFRPLLRLPLVCWTFENWTSKFVIQMFPLFICLLFRSPLYVVKCIVYLQTKYWFKGLKVVKKYKHVLFLLNLPQMLPSIDLLCSNIEDCESTLDDIEQVLKDAENFDILAWRVTQNENSWIRPSILYCSILKLFALQRLLVQQQKNIY